jgi:hypothetical protein
MPYYSLVIKLTNTVTQIIDSADKRFDVHENYMWVEGPDTYDQLTEYRYNPTTNKIEEVINPPGPFETERRMSYPGAGDQFDHLWHDMDQGIIPGKESSAWYQAIKAIKDSIPKPE